MEIVIFVDYDLPDCLGSEKALELAGHLEIPTLIPLQKGHTIDWCSDFGPKSHYQNIYQIEQFSSKGNWNIQGVLFMPDTSSYDEGYLQSHMINYLTQALYISLNSGKRKGFLQTSRSSSLKFEGTLMNMMGFGILRFGAKVAAA